MEKALFICLGIIFIIVVGKLVLQMLVALFTHLLPIVLVAIAAFFLVKLAAKYSL